MITQMPQNKKLMRSLKGLLRKRGIISFLSKKELNFLPEVLMNDEEVLAFSSVFMDGNTWLITLTNKRVIFLDKDLVYGLKQVSIPMDRIQNVSGQTGIIFGDISISDGSSTFKIKNVIKTTVKPFTNMVQIEIEKQRNNSPGSSANMTSNNEVDPLEKLEKLAGLLEKGILSQEEFDAEKTVNYLLLLIYQ